MRTTAIILSIVMCTLIAAPAMAVPSNDPPGLEKLRPFCGKLTGRVVDIDTMNTVAGATIEVTDNYVGNKRFLGAPWLPEHEMVDGILTYFATSDDNGHYEFNNLPAGYYSWICYADGYNPSGNDGVPVYSGLEMSNNILMWSNP